MKHTITTPAGRRVTIAAYIAAIRRCQDNPAEMFKGWQWFPVSGEDVLRDFGQMVTDHCNRGLAIAPAVSMHRAMRRYRAGVETVCRGCGGRHIRHNPNNSSDRYCSASCRAA